MVAVLLIAGDQVPFIAGEFVEEVGKVIVPPEHIAAIGLNVGVIFGLTVMVIVAVVAHNPAVGVNVYVVVAVLFIAGDHVPVTPLFEVVGKADKAAPEQIGTT